MRRVLLTCINFFILLLPLNVFAWNALGHMVVASIAYQNLKPSVKRAVDEMVVDFSSEYPEMDSFLHLAYWPDTLRFQRINTYARWHYIDIPFTNDNSPLVNTIVSDNGVWAIDNVQLVVQNKKANPFERARFLSFLVHLVGDIHQPLHSSTLISATHPNGDKGGNLYYVYYNHRKTKLHELWDNGFGEFSLAPTVENAKSLAKKITTFHPPSEFGSLVYNLEAADWSQEGLQHARNYVYKTSENADVKPAYVDSSQKHAEEQVALAGYRLAGLLNELLS